jgi:hypothetical protein
MKIVGFILIFFSVLLAMRWWSAHQRRQEELEKKEAEAKAYALRGEPVVRCARCNAHIPKSTALMIENGWQCKDESSCKPSKS